MNTDINMQAARCVLRLNSVMVIMANSRFWCRTGGVSMGESVRLRLDPGDGLPVNCG
jgi:hypothetical protein